MKKETLKIGIIFLIVVGLVIWGLNYVFLNQNGPKSKAAGETMAVSFNPTTQTPAVNQDLTVSVLIKPSINTILRGYTMKLSFDKAKLAFKSIQYKLGAFSDGLGNTIADATIINNNGLINITGEDTTATGYTLTAANGAEIAAVTFTALSTIGNSISTNYSSYFYSITSDMSLFSDWIITAQNLDINGGGAVPTNGPTPTGNLTPTTLPTTMITGPITGNVKLNLKLKFQGITKLPATGENSMTVKVKAQKQGESTTTDGTGTFVSDAAGLWTGAVGINLTNVTGKYKILVKGPQHIQKKICDALPTETSAGTYKCSDGNISLVVGDNNLNFSGIVLLSGDLDQNGIVDSVDFGLVKNNLGKTDATALAKADINRDGRVDTQDYSLIISALSIKSDEL
jgi:hypothetical protein